MIFKHASEEKGIVYIKYGILNNKQKLLNTVKLIPVS